MKAKGG